jgi:probable HAF family extracellular repeat protein
MFLALSTAADVTILSPTNGTVFPAYSTVTIEVQPDFKDGDNSVRYGVLGNEFFQPENMIASVGTPPYSLTLSNLPAGTHRYAAWTSDSSPRAYVEIVVTNPPVHTGPYSVVILDIAASGINNNGVIAGTAGRRAYTWDKGIIRAVPMPDSNESAATAINDAGQVTGWLYTTNRKQTAFLHSDGVTRTIDIPSADSSIGLALSPRGDIMGHFVGEGGFPFRGFIYTADGVLITNELEAGGINSWGTYVGTDDANRHAAIGGALVDQFLAMQLGPLDFPSGADSINDAGQVAAWGRALDDGRHNHNDAFLYSNYRLINLTEGSFYHVARARALNRWGQVVGEITPALHGPRGTFEGYGDPSPFLWSEGQRVDLNSLMDTNSNWILTKAVGINDHGQIIADAKSGSVYTSLLLNPRPRVLETTLTGGEVNLRVHERPSTTLKVQSSTNFTSWTTVSTNIGGAAIRELKVPVGESGGFQFYRVINDEQYGNEVVGN